MAGNDGLRTKLDAPTFFCHVCCEEWPESYCATCGASLVHPKENDSGSGSSIQADRSRANKEATE